MNHEWFEDIQKKNQDSLEQELEYESEALHYLNSIFQFKVEKTYEKVNESFQELYKLIWNDAAGKRQSKYIKKSVYNALKKVLGEEQ